MKIDELLRNAPANIHDLHLALAGLPNNMKVKAHPETGVSEKTVDELRARTTWPAGLVVMTPRKLKPKAAMIMFLRARNIWSALPWIVLR